MCDACTPAKEAVAPPRAELDIGHCGAASGHQKICSASPVDAQDVQINVGEALDVVEHHSVSAIGAEKTQAQTAVEVAQAQDIYETAMPALQGLHEKALTEISQTSTYVRAKASDLGVKANELLGEESISKVQECAAVIGEKAQAAGASFWSGLWDLHRTATESVEEAGAGQRLRP